MRPDGVEKNLLDEVGQRPALGTLAGRYDTVRIEAESQIFRFCQPVLRALEPATITPCVTLRFNLDPGHPDPGLDPDAPGAPGSHPLPAGRLRRRDRARGSSCAS